MNGDALQSRRRAVGAVALQSLRERNTAVEAELGDRMVKSTTVLSIGVQTKFNNELERAGAGDSHRSARGARARSVGHIYTRN